MGFFQGDIRLLSDDMKALRPTIFPVVPRLLNRMYDKVGPTDWKVLICWCERNLGFRGTGFLPSDPGLKTSLLSVFPKSSLRFLLRFPSSLQNSG